MSAKYAYEITCSDRRVRVRAREIDAAHEHAHTPYSPRSEESQDSGDEESFVIVESLPIFEVVREIKLLGSPKAGLCLLVHVPDILILDGKENEPVAVLL